MEYPEKTCDVARLVTNKSMVQAVLNGEKTQQRRNGVYAYPGEQFELERRCFELAELRRQRLGDMTEEDAIAEGYASLEAYKDVILSMHKGMQWDEEALVWLHTFRPIEAGVNS
ncbi:MAG: ASCH domain-containing protein [bacterium]|nr:ASCH domain-containing protein [bacterium]